MLLMKKFFLIAAILFSILDAFQIVNPYLLSYAREIRYGGAALTAFYSSAPDSLFSVATLFPRNGYFSPTISLGAKSPSKSFRYHVNYIGFFGPNITANEVSGELSFIF